MSNETRILLALLSVFPVEMIGGEYCFVLGPVPGVVAPMGQRLLPLSWVLRQPKPRVRSSPHAER